jgi:phosphoribosylformimino-5-aminoimidazole carboxamide ribotide isomerase
MRTVIIPAPFPHDRPFRVVPVLDIKGGNAVHAIGGDRAHYRPLASRLHPGSDPVAIARAYRDVLGLDDLYLADLDAIAGAPPAFALYRALSALGLSLWVDAGLNDGRLVPELLESGVSIVIAGLETLGGPVALTAVLERATPGRVLFSLDLRDGQPVVAPGSDWPECDAGGLAGLAILAGARRLLLLDLARVGGGEGLGTLSLLARFAEAYPSVALGAGGGIRDSEGLRALRRSGATFALVGSALHKGLLTRETLATVSHEQGPL